MTEGWPVIKDAQVQAVINAYENGVLDSFVQYRLARDLADLRAGIRNLGANVQAPYPQFQAALDALTNLVPKEQK